MSGLLLVSEIFGPTFQGEGPSTGMRAGFVRLGGCNLACSWCDTAYTWAYSDALAARHQEGKKYNPRVELRKLTCNQVAAEIEDMDVPLIVITGGEPMLQKDREHFAALIAWATTDGYMVEIETNGTVDLLEFGAAQTASAGSWHQVNFNVSPKLASSGNQDVSYAALPAYRDLGAAFKFVACTPADLDEVDALVNEWGIDPRSVYIMPEGRTSDVISKGLKTLAPHVLERRYNLSNRLHVQIWGDERGR